MKRAPRSTPEMIDGEASLHSLGNRLLTPAQQIARDTKKSLGIRSTLGPRLRDKIGKPAAAARPQLGERHMAIAEIRTTLAGNPAVFDTLLSAEMRRIPRSRKGALEIFLSVERERSTPRPDVIAQLEGAIANPPENGTQAGGE